MKMTRDKTGRELLVDLERKFLGDENAAGTKTSEAESYIRLAIAKDPCYSEARVKDNASRTLIYSPIYASYGNFSGITFSLEGSPPRGTIFAEPFGWSNGIPDIWNIMNISRNGGVIKDRQLENAITSFVKEKPIPIVSEKR